MNIQSRLFKVYFVTIILLSQILPLYADIKDSESATHGDDASSYQIVETYKYPGFKVIQFNLAVLSHYSYMLISSDQAYIVDPGRDVFTYLETAEKEKAIIKGVLLSHSHADFVAGHIELAKMTGCPIYFNASSGAEYEFKHMKEGDTLPVGEALIKFIETPGHTPDGMCIYVYSQQKKDFPELVFTGDTLFVGSVGRPDLLEGKLSASSLASMMFDTWYNKLSKLDDSVVILPAHGAGSLCGAHLSDKPSSTIGEQRASNPYLKYKSRNEFITAILEDLPEAPQYFKYNAAMNKKGPALIDWKASLPQELSASMDITDPAKYYVVDIRSAKDYANGHIPNSVNIGLRGRLETWVGIMVPWEANLVLTADKTDDIKEAIYRLHRVGYKAGFISIPSWKSSGLHVSINSLIQPAKLYELMQTEKFPLIVDVRLPSEWMGLRIGTVLNLPLNHLAELSGKLDPKEPVVTVCNSAYRSSMGIGILERKSFKNVSSMEGGSEAWIEAGLPVYKSIKKDSGEATAQAAPKREITLPDRISVSELKRLIMDLPETFDLVDIRPASYYVDFNIPGSKNVDIAELIHNPVYLTGAGPLIIVDRDGSLSMAVAGILSQKTKRTIKALYGGVEAYWAESEMRSFTVPDKIPAVQFQKQTPKPQGSEVQPTTPKPEPKKKSGGC